MKKDLATIFGLFLVIVALLVFGQSFTSVGFVRQGTQSSKLAAKGGSLVAVSVKTLSVDTVVASRAGDRQKGLGKRDSLPLNQGMLFVFEQKGQYTFWMKDMKFAIDIIWIDENKRIVDMVLSVPPEPGKKDNELRRYEPRGEALYVLEINAGLSALNGLQIGDQVNFQIQ